MSLAVVLAIGLVSGFVVGCRYGPLPPCRWCGRAQDDAQEVDC